MLFSVRNCVHFSCIFAQVITNTIPISAHTTHRTGHKHPFIVQNKNHHIAFFISVPKLYNSFLVLGQNFKH